MERDESLTEEVRSCLRMAGAQLIGFAEPAFFSAHGGGFHPEKILPGAKTVIVAGAHVADNNLDAWVEYPPWGRPRSFLDELLRASVQEACLLLERRGFRAEAVTYQPGLLMKNAAAIAGMGFIGRNNLLVTTRYGPRVRLRAAVTRAPLLCGAPTEFGEQCLSCVKCIEACPAKALSEAGYSVSRCYAYQQGHLEHPFPGATVWCTVCSDVCPVGGARFDVV